MSKSTIFGEEHFINTQMIKLVEQRNNAIDNYVFEQMENAIKGTLFVEMPQVEIDKEKLKKWVILCMKLENIEQSELIDMATKKKISDLEAKLAESKEFLIATKWKVQDLEQQLAKKEKLLKKYASTSCPINQDKIDYAVEQLELARRTIDSFRYNENKCLNKKDCIEDCIEAIDNRIKKLKEGK